MRNNSICYHSYAEDKQIYLAFSVTSKFFTIEQWQNRGNYIGRSKGAAVRFLKQKEQITSPMSSGPTTGFLLSIELILNFAACL